MPKIISRTVDKITVTTSKRTWWNSPIRIGDEIIRLVCDGRRSRQYYRNEDKVLTSLFDGLDILRTGMICTDEEWEAMKNGNFGRFMK